jgi:hypothetical protein
MYNDFFMGSSGNITKVLLTCALLAPEVAFLFHVALVGCLAARHLVIRRIKMWTEMREGGTQEC